MDRIEDNNDDNISISSAASKIDEKFNKYAEIKEDLVELEPENEIKFIESK